MWKRLWIVVLAVSLMGCGANSFTDRPARLSFRPEKQGVAQTEEEVLTTYYGTLPAGMTRQSYRDKIVRRQIALDDDSFNEFVRTVRSDRALMNMSADGGAIFLNGLGAVTGTAGEKAALAVLSGGLLSSKGSVDRHLFNQEAMSALLSRMKAARLAALVPIQRGLAESDQRYPLDQALIDLRAYANAGSLLATIEAISNDAGEVAAQARKDFVEVQRDVVYRDSLDQRDALTARLKALSGNQLTSLAAAMEVPRVRRSLPLQKEIADADIRNHRFQDPARAADFLLYWLGADDGTPAEMAEWNTAITAAEKAKP